VFAPDMRRDKKVVGVFVRFRAPASLWTAEINPRFKDLASGTGEIAKRPIITSRFALSIGNPFNFNYVGTSM
jgi:hypothetical protein